MWEWLRNTAHKALQITHGRTTAFFIMFFVAGHVMAFLDKLTPVYVGYMTALGGLVVGHSFKDELAQKWNGKNPPAGPDPMPGGENDDKG